jgi:subtilisin family serine protease
MTLHPWPAVSCAAILAIALPGIASAQESVSIRLASRSFDPLDASLALSSRQGYSGKYHLLQFSGPVREEWKEECRGRGIEFLDYIPDFAFIVRAAPERLDAAAALPFVRWIGPYRSSCRVDSTLLAASRLKKGDNPEIIVTLFPGAAADQAIAEMIKSGGKVVRRTDGPVRTKLRVRAPGAAIEKIAAIEGVKWVERAPRLVWHNNKAGVIVRARTAWTNLSGILGTGQVVGVADSGLDMGTTDPAALHEDFEDGNGQSRVLAISSWSSGTRDLIGHGTHVSGTILGNGAKSGSTPLGRVFPSTCYAGIAPEASLVMQNVSAADGSLAGVPDDLNILFSQARAGGARVHNNSWGVIGAGEYGSMSEDVDEFASANPDFLIVFSAGNDGVDANFDGVIDLFSIGPPATAKNCITVGATENNRPPTSDPWPAHNMTYGWYGPDDYPADPINSDFVSDDIDGLAAFSSRGSERDARFKPELVAPGTNLISCRTQAVAAAGSVLWGPGGLTGDDANNYVFSGGTSMSAPVVTGAAALVRQYYTDRFGIAPSAALVKATLINGAKDISPGQYGTGATREIPEPPRPNNVEGWGLIDLGSTVFSPAPLDFYYFDVTGGGYTGSVHTYPVTVSSSIYPFSATLVWMDHPGSTPAEGPLVNDLDLTVTDPLGIVHHANRATLAGPISYDDGAADGYYHGDEGFIESVRFTPSCYPATVERAMFYLDSTAGEYSKTIQYRIYAAGSGAPGSLLASGTTVLRRAGWHVIEIPGGVTIHSGSFHLALVMPDNDLVWGWDHDDPIAERSWEYTPMTGWYQSIRNYMFRAVVSCPTLNDRVNNVEGIDIAAPSAGTYLVTVNGYNVPYGPQPYALVVSRPNVSANLPARVVLDSGDYNGDGTSDIAVFRRQAGFWSIRGIGQYYFGSAADIPTSGDYNGDGTSDIAIFQPSSGLWAVRAVTRAVFGADGDIPVPADYNGDGRTDMGIFREDLGLWRIRDFTKVYLGKAGDFPVPGDYEGLMDGKADFSIYRPSQGLWALRGFSRFYLGTLGDFPVPADYDVFPGDDLAIFRGTNGMWHIYGYSKYYFGQTGDKLVPADYDGDDIDDIAIFRDTLGFWSAMGKTTAYFGMGGDVPVTR